MSPNINLKFAELASKGEVDLLHNLILSNSEGFSKYTAFAFILCFLPEAIDTQEYSKLINTLYDLPDTPLITQQSDIGKDVALYADHKLERYGWQSLLSFSDDFTVQRDDILSMVTKCYIRKNDAATRSLKTPEELLNFTSEISQQLLAWQLSTVDTLRDFRRYYSAHNQPWISLMEFEDAKPEKVIPFLLQYSTRETIHRDINTLVIPYLSFYGGEDSLWDWVGSKPDSTKHLGLIETLLAQGGVSNTPYQDSFLRSVVAASYRHSETTEASYELLRSINTGLNTCDSISNGESYDNDKLSPFNADSSFSEFFDSKLTSPTKKSFKLLGTFIKAADTLNITVLDIAFIALLGTEEDQQRISCNYIFGADSPDDKSDWKSFDSDIWNTKLNSLNWLQENVLHKLQRGWIEETLLIASLETASFSFVKRHYFESAQTPLHPAVITNLTLKAFYTFYDSATNGNTTRGIMKNASQCLQLLAPGEKAIYEAEILLSAAHELSNYTLYLQSEKPGESSKNMPMTPKQIRNYPDKLGLVHRVLELNPKAYLDYDKLVSISSNLCHGTTQNIHLDSEKNAMHIRKMCIEAALVDSNFDKAYDYALPSLLSVAPTAKGILLQESDAETEEREIESWTSLYQIGKYISPFWDSDNIPLNVLQRKMQALSYSLKLCPQEQIPAILHTWQRYDKLRDEALKRAENSTLYNVGQTLSAAVSSAPSLLPANFTKVLSSTASSISVSSSPGSSMNPRKRDQISNLLVSGLGWARK